MTYHDGILRCTGIKPLFDFDRNPKLHMYILFAQFVAVNSAPQAPASK
jgi:hypothetical protein